MSEQLRLRQLDYKYALEIDKFWKRDKAIAYGQVKLFAELMLFTDMEQRPRDRAKALKLLMLEAFRGIEDAGLPECYCLVKDMRFARLIANRYDFKLIENPGVLLVRDMR
jgi:hypothetical protein